MIVIVPSSKLLLFKVKLIEAEDKYAIGDEPYPYVQATFKWASTKYPKYPKFTIGDEMYLYVQAYMQKTCDVAEKAILAKKNCGKSA